MEWRTIDSAPENTDLLTYAAWSEPEIGVSRFRNIKCVREEVEHESHNAKGRRRIVQEVSYASREWEGSHWEPTHWMPLPDPPTPDDTASPTTP